MFSLILFCFSERCGDEINDVGMDTSFTTEHHLLIPDSTETRGVNNNMSWSKADLKSQVHFPAPFLEKKNSFVIVSQHLTKASPRLT